MKPQVLLALLGIIVSGILSAIALKCIQCDFCPYAPLPEATECEDIEATYCAMGTKMTEDNYGIERVKRHCDIREDEWAVNMSQLIAGINISVEFCKTDGCNKKTYVKQDPDMKCIQCEGCPSEPLPEATKCEQDPTHCFVAWVYTANQPVDVGRYCWTYVEWDSPGEEPNRDYSYAYPTGEIYSVEICATTGCNNKTEDYQSAFLKCLQCDPCTAESPNYGDKCPYQNQTHCKTEWVKKDGQETIIRKKCDVDPPSMGYCHEKDGAEVCVKYCNSTVCNQAMDYTESHAALINCEDTIILP